MATDPRPQLCLWSRCVRPCSIPLIKWTPDHYALALKDELISKRNLVSKRQPYFDDGWSSFFATPFHLLFEYAKFGKERKIDERIVNGLKAFQRMEWNFIFVLSLHFNYHDLFMPSIYRILSIEDSSILLEIRARNLKRIRSLRRSMEKIFVESVEFRVARSTSLRSDIWMAFPCYSRLRWKLCT